MKTKYFIILVLAMMTIAHLRLSGQDWPMFRGNPQHWGCEEQTTDTLYKDLAWSFQSDGAIFSSPIVFQNQVFFASVDNYIYCVNDSTGALKWNTRLDNWVESTPAIANGMIYIGCMDHKIYALDIECGNIQWSFETSSWIESSPVVVGTCLYVGGTDYLYCLDAMNGQEKWKFNTTKYIVSSPAYWDGKIYFGSDDGNFYALDSTGQKLWQYATGGFSIASSPSVKDSIVVFGTIDNGVKAYRETKVVNSPYNKIVALDAITGDLKWEQLTENFGLMHTSPAMMDSTIFYSTDRGVLRALNLKNGKIRWQQSLPDSGLVWSSPAVAAGVVYLTSYSGNLTLFGADSGQVLGQYQIGEPGVYIHASPAISQNYLYFGASNGHIYALGKVANTSLAQNAVSMPVSPTLWQNYPNPFNLTTTIQYRLLIPDFVTIKIYNTLGQIVRTLVRHEQLPGTHQITWDGRSDFGNEVTSGAYTIEIQAGNFRQTRKMMVLK
ncbi:PQQ-binding-like beta-propeller repeat protein [candidate division KSB1 bacterium]|nr:PQQ-binding-like beta-propeller repeat protein [candidate division KSB1 bacterium]